jgi:hypothetical protein
MQAPRSQGQFKRLPEDDEATEELFEWFGEFSKWRVAAQLKTRMQRRSAKHKSKDSVCAKPRDTPYAPGCKTQPRAPMQRKVLVWAQMWTPQGFVMCPVQTL